MQHIKTWSTWCLPSAWPIVASPFWFMLFFLRCFFLSVIGEAEPTSLVEEELETPSTAESDRMKTRRMKRTRMCFLLHVTQMKRSITHQHFEHGWTVWSDIAALLCCSSGRELLPVPPSPPPAGGCWRWQGLKRWQRAHLNNRASQTNIKWKWKKGATEKKQKTSLILHEHQRK